MFTIKKICTCCKSEDLTTFLSLGEVPLAGSFVDDIDDTVLFPLSLSFCSNCSHIQVNEYIDKSYLFKDYRYASGYSMKPHFEEFAKTISDTFGGDANILEIGSNDGTFLDFLSKNNSVVGVEPSENISKIAMNKGHNIINDFFNAEALCKNGILSNTFDIISGSNCLAHIENIDDVLTGVNYALKESGTFILEIHYGPNLFKTGQYDFIYHEHMYYYSLNSLKALLNRHKLAIYDVSFIETHGGSIRVFTHKISNSSFQESVRLQQAYNQEKEAGFNMLSTYMKFSDKIYQHISDTKKVLENVKKEGKRIIAFGASGRVNAYLNYANIDNNTIDFILDESIERSNRFIPNVNIPIKHYDATEKIETDYLFITAWNFFNQIINKCTNISYNHTIVVFPDIEIKRYESTIDRT